MFQIIEPNRFEECKDLIDQIYRLRAKVFGERLGWDVEVVEGMEKDAYDRLGPLYLVLTDRSEREVVASARFLPSTGPTLLTDVFHKTLPEEREFFSPTIWECTRFCIDEERAAEHYGRSAMFRIARMMFLACGDFALRSGIDTIVATFDDRMLRVVQRAGIKLDLLRYTDDIGTRRVYSALFPISRELRAELRRILGIERDLFERIEGPAFSQAAARLSRLAA